MECQFENYDNFLEAYFSSTFNSGELFFAYLKPELDTLRRKVYKNAKLNFVEKKEVVNKWVAFSLAEKWLERQQETIKQCKSQLSFDDFERPAQSIKCTLKELVNKKMLSVETDIEISGSRNKVKYSLKLPGEPIKKRFRRIKPKQKRKKL
ncbi:hypothetical protein C2G38_2046656 [Gigaspora rosea]|uniref:Uncharacterized protein n=1 Tax=Gigaspora rosea TaxID=44941 RepID=A0A397UCZ2_9GLOM|nr:hypothetical protein C2G38_2046656 [Gigaspora rosea]